MTVSSFCYLYLNRGFDTKNEFMDKGNKTTVIIKSKDFDGKKQAEAYSSVPTEMSTVQISNETSPIGMIIDLIKSAKYLDLLKQFNQEHKKTVKNSKNKYTYCLVFKFC